jgi:hypothetical protein
MRATSWGASFQLELPWNTQVTNSVPYVVERQYIVEKSSFDPTWNTTDLLLRKLPNKSYLWRHHISGIAKHMKNQSQMAVPQNAPIEEGNSAPKKNMLPAVA